MIIRSITIGGFSMWVHRVVSLESLLNPYSHVQGSRRLGFSPSSVKQIFETHTLYYSRKITNGRVIQALQCHQRAPGNCQFATFPSWVGSLIVMLIAKLDNEYINSLADSNLKQPSGFASNPRSALQKATSRLKADRTSEVAIRGQLKEQSNILSQESVSSSLTSFCRR